MSVLIEISVGELLDKISILQIKSERIKEPLKLQNVNKELQVLTSSWEASDYPKKSIMKLMPSLKSVNESLWEIEDKIRIKEKQAIFNTEFINLARSVYKLNDERASIKLQINQMVGSKLIEEKSYCSY